MAAATNHLAKAHAAYARQAWAEARDAFAAQLEQAGLGLDDLERLATAGLLTGRAPESEKALAQGYHQASAGEQPVRAARFAVWLGFNLRLSGEWSQSAGWLERARTLLVENDLDTVERGFLLIPDGFAQLYGGDPAVALEVFTTARSIGRRWGDLSLQALAGNGCAKALLGTGEPALAMKALDEVMVAITSGEVNLMVTGTVYCGVLEVCREAFDTRRAAEWSAALGRWCDAQPDLVPYRGPCLVYRAEIQQLHGDWDAAAEQAGKACEWLSLPSTPEGAGDAFYLVGELHRLRGDLSRAEDAFRTASRLGRRPEPGLPLLWLARGEADSAKAAISRALDETTFDLSFRFTLLDACVEISVATGDIHRARTATEEMAEIALKLDAPLLDARAARAAATVLLAEGEVSLALPHLRRAWAEYQRLDAAYEAATVRILIGRAYRELGDDESALMEFDAARWVLERLGAAPDIERLDTLTRAKKPHQALHGLTRREIDVLQLLAAGRTNKQIGTALVISEHTVARHVQNMLGKLDAPSRSGLAAFAAEHGLLSQRDGQS